ncbi:hypothetical protein M8J76_011841 [Diaphorina citri]|nr:hypothetical protein M8J76_011841 [Diaphorina citri]
MKDADYSTSIVFRLFISPEILICTQCTLVIRLLPVSSDSYYAMINNDYVMRRKELDFLFTSIEEMVIGIHGVVVRGEHETVLPYVVNQFRITIQPYGSV